MRKTVIPTRRIAFNVLFVAILVFVVPHESNAQARRRLSSADKAFQVFFTKFRAAVARRNKSSVAALTLFPFKYGFDTGDEGTFSKAQFVARFNDMFGGQSVFRQSNPLFYTSSGRFELVNEDDASHFVFRKVGGIYKFVSYMSEP